MPVETEPPHLKIVQMGKLVEQLDTVEVLIRELESPELNPTEQDQRARSFLGEMINSGVFQLTEGALEDLENPAKKVRALWRLFERGKPDGRIPAAQEKDAFTYSED